MVNVHYNFHYDNAERIGLCFCNTNERTNVRISPGLSALMNGSTFKNTMKRKAYNALTEIEVAGQRCRLVRTRNKTIALFEGSEEATQFAQACAVLARWGELEENLSITPRKISVDAMVVGYVKGEVADYEGCLIASEKHEVIVYEDRGDNLSFLKPRRMATNCSEDSWGHPIANTGTLSGSERLQQKNAEEAQKKNGNKKGKTTEKGRISATVEALNAAARAITGIAKKKLSKLSNEVRQTTAVANFLKEPKTAKRQQQATRTRADMGQVKPPQLRPATGPLDHMINAFLEFQAVTKATRVVNEMTCKNILQSFSLGCEGLLKVRLEEADATIYNNDTSQVLKGTNISQHMVAYNATSGFVALDEEETQRTGTIRFKTPDTDPIVVTARCTKVMLDDRILGMAEAIATCPASGDPFYSWEVPKITWVNGVPGCGKTTWVISRFDGDRDIIVTTTTEAAKDLRERMALRLGIDARTKVRTMASILVNGLNESDKKRCSRLMVDEALMNHFGAIVMATRITGAKEVLLIGDINQLPYIDRENLFTLQYNRPGLVASIDQELLCTHRNPMDVAYALNEIYSGIYSSKMEVQSLQLKRFSGALIPKALPDTLYLVHTQVEKETLVSEGYGTGNGSRTLTIHEAQGLTFPTVVIVRTSGKKLQLHDSVPHAVVAVSRHTVSCVYYTDDTDDAIGRFISRAAAAGTPKIVDYNLKMAMRNRDKVVIAQLVKAREREGGCSSEER